MDCYIITKDKLGAGGVYECEPIGLLDQFEGDEIDHKILAQLPGQHVDITPELLKELQDFIYAIFARFPEIQVRVGPIHPKGQALRYIQGHRNA